MLAGTVSVVPSGGSTSVIEGGAADSYTIALDTMPTGPVEIILDSSLDQVQLSIDGGASFGFFQSLTLSDTTPATVLVRGHEDGAAEGTHTDSIVHFILNSADPVNYPFSTVIPSLDVTIQDSPSETSANILQVAFNGDMDNINRSSVGTMTVTFDMPVNMAGAGGLNLFNHTTGTPVDTSAASLLGNGTANLTWDFTGVTLPEGHYTAELPRSQVTTLAGGELSSTHTLEFHVLSGDLDGDTVVNFNDTVPISMHFGESGTAYMNGDADGDGVVNFNDTVPQSVNFGASLAELTHDFGDAPEGATSFPTTLANDGARHVISGNTLFLGVGRDAETDGQLGGDGADEDGVTVDPLNVAEPATITVTSSGAGFVNGWIDFNQDGDWDDAGEHVLDNVAVGNGANVLQISVPADAVPGEAWARFRLTSTAGYGPGGLAPDGEVEDYLLTVSDPVVEFDEIVTDDSLFDTAVPTADAEVVTAPVLMEMRANPPTLFGRSTSLFDFALRERDRRR